MKMSITLAVSKQSHLFHVLKTTSKKHSITNPSLLRHLSADSNDRPLPPPPGPSLTTRILTHLQTTSSNEWTTNDTLHQLLFADSPPSLLHITRGLGSSDKALQFLDFIRANSPSPPDTRSLSSIFQAIFELASREKPNSLDKLDELFTVLKSNNIALSINAATLLVRCFGRAGLFEKSLLVYNELDPESRNTHVRNVMLDVLLRAGRVDDARKLLDEMLSPGTGFPPNGHTIDIVLASALKPNWRGRTLTEEEVVCLILKFGDHNVFPNAVGLADLVSGLCRRGKWEMAWDFLHDLMKQGGHLEASSFNALLTGLGRKHQFERMNLLLKEMKEKGIEPSVVTYGIIINHLCKSRRIDEALELFEKMKGGSESDDFSVEPDVVVYNTLIDGLCKVGRQEEGLALTKQMRSKNDREPNTITYNCLIDGFCKAGEIERSLKLLEEMDEEGVPPNVVTVNTLVDGMCKHGRINSALEFFIEVQQKRGIMGNVVTYTTLISAFCSANNIDKGMKLFDEMMKTGCSADAIVYYSLINGLCQAGRMDDATYIVSLLKNAGFSLDIVSYNALIGAFCRRKKVDKAYELLEDMEQAGLKPDTITYNTLISFFSQNGDLTTASRVMKKMIKEGFVPTVVTYGAVINAYCLEGNISEAMKIFREMRDASRIPPNTVIYNILINNLCKNKEVEDALSLLDDMICKGVRPNTTTYNSIFKGLEEENLLEKALELMDQMIEQACNPDYITMEILTNWLPAIGHTENLRRFVQGYGVSSATA